MAVEPFEAKPRATGEVTREEVTRMTTNGVGARGDGVDYALIFENLPGMVVAVDHETSAIAFCNGTLCKATGYSKGEVEGRPLSKIYHGTSREVFETALERLTATGEVRNAELSLKRKDGSELPIILNVRRISGPHGARNPSISLWSHIRNLDRRWSREGLLAELERSNEELERFAYVASHDLQEPLRMVASYTELLAERYEGKLDEKADKYIGYTLDGVKRMQRLISDLLALSRVGRTTQGFRNVDLGIVCGEAVSTLGKSVEETGAAIRVGPLPTVCGDPTQLERVFQNLVGNALKYRGADPPRIEIRAEARTDFWEISVADNGIGFRQKQAERVFDMFQRLQPRGRYPGTGIGLAIVQKIVRLHGGRIRADATPNEGATFTFTLPREPEHRACIEKDEHFPPVRLD